MTTPINVVPSDFGACAALDKTEFSVGDVATLVGVPWQTVYKWVRKTSVPREMAPLVLGALGRNQEAIAAAIDVDCWPADLVNACMADPRDLRQLCGFILVAGRLIDSDCLATGTTVDRWLARLRPLELTYEQTTAARQAAQQVIYRAEGVAG